MSTPARSPGGGVVSYDRRSFKLDRSPFLILSGSVHYIRVHPSRWPRLFQTFHDAHLNTIETYVFWGHHEPCPLPTASPFDPLPPITFAAHLDFFAFISAAHAAGLRVILRLGPYVCAEVEYGGLPVRMRDEPNMRLRAWNDAFKARLEAWITLVVTTLRQRELLASQGGPIIAVQLENEYSMVSHTYGADGVKYLQWVSDLQKRLDLGVPAIMCYGAADGVVETINAFYAHKNIHEHRKNHPDQPPVWTECWTGWYDVWGAPHHYRPVKDLLYAVARFFAAGGAGVNYYMWMGGTNVGRASTMYLQTTSYDYDAPINELYRHTPKSRCLTALHKVLLDRFEQVFHKRRDNDPKPVDVEGTDGNVTMYNWDGLVFLCNDSHASVSSVELKLGELDAKIAVFEPRSVQILDGQSLQCLFDTSAIYDQMPKSSEHKERSFEVLAVGGEWTFREEQVPTLMSIAELMCRQAKDESHRDKRDEARPVLVDQNKPKEMVALNRGSSDYAFYVARYEIGAGVWTMQFEAADFAQVFVDGKLRGATKLPLWEDRWCNRWNKYADGGPGCNVTIKVDSQDGDSGANQRQVEICVMVSSLGLVKGDWQLGERNMLEEAKGLLSDVSITSDLGWVGRRISPWHSVGKLDGEVKDWGTANVLKGGMETVERKDVHAPAWFSCELQVHKVSNAWMLDLGKVGKGVLFVNGVLLGRFWDIAGTRPKNGFLKDAPIMQVGEEPLTAEADDAEGEGSDCKRRPASGTNTPERTQRYYHIPAWLADQAGSAGSFAQEDGNEGSALLGGDERKVSLHVVLMVERGPLPTERLLLLEAIDGADGDERALT